MGKIIKLLLVLGIVIAGVYVAVEYGSGGEKKRKAQTQGQREGMEVQEKYGFAPTGALTP